jgi:hypothetical protein
MGATPEEIAAGHVFYTKRVLAVYDIAILGFFSRAAWKCPAARIVAHYDIHVSSNHLDVGVGTGYFLDRCRFPTTEPRLALMDPNPNCLDVAAHRIARYEPELHRGDVLQPIEWDGPRFDSVGLNYVLHCLPGTIRSKAVVFEHLKPLLHEGGTVFGATLLHDGVERNWLARRVMDRNNAHGIFTNADDDLAGLRLVLGEQLVDPQVEIEGCVALFSGKVSAGPQQ